MKVTSTAEDGRYRLAFDEAVRRVQAQESQLDELRSRAGLMLGVSAGVTSLLGALVLSRSHHSTVLIVVALALFGLATAAFGAVVWPRDNWKFQMSAKTIIDGWIEGDNPAEANEFLRGLAVVMDDNAAENETKIQPLWRFFEAGGIALAVETIIWLVALAVH
jgi:hypothetical protein